MEGPFTKHLASRLGGFGGVLLSMFAGRLPETWQDAGLAVAILLIAVAVLVEIWGRLTTWRAKRGAKMSVDIAIALGAGLVVAVAVFVMLRISPAKVESAAPSSPAASVATVPLTAEQIADAMLGRNNFAYFSLYTTEPKDLNAPFQLSITGVGGPVRDVNYWIAPASSKATNDGNDPYYSIDVRKPLIPIIFEGTRAFPRALPAGEYRIEFDSASSGNWNQWLTIEKTPDGKLRQRIRVVSDKRGLLYELETPEPAPPQVINSGGKGGDATVTGSGYAIGGPGGGAGVGGRGGDGGSGHVSGTGIAIGGEGGEAGQADRGGRGGRSGFEFMGIPNVQLPDGTWLWDKGRGGDGAPPFSPKEQKKP